VRIFFIIIINQFLKNFILKSYYLLDHIYFYQDIYFYLDMI